MKKNTPTTTQKLVATMVGFKATDANMKCRGLQFVLNEWQEVTGELETCKNGLHFCEYPSGPWAFYNDPTTRIFKVEAEGVLDVPRGPGAAFKRVARRLRLVEEMVSTGDRNTGYRNTGSSNTGDSNTGDSNTGNRNTGNSNTGNRNTGNRNTGNSNTGNRNTGNRNTGNRNTGNRNTGDSNTGNRNTGDSNTGNFSSGFFCQNEPTVICFDGETGLSREQFNQQFDIYPLSVALSSAATIDFEEFSHLPNITPEKLLSLHQKHKDGRK